MTSAPTSSEMSATALLPRKTKTALKRVTVTDCPPEATALVHQHWMTRMSRMACPQPVMQSYITERDSFLFLHITQEPRGVSVKTTHNLVKRKKVPLIMLPHLFTFEGLVYARHSYVF